jgi:UDP-N-acetylglucosamine 2-epimerase (non-hydrolysing)
MLDEALDDLNLSPDISLSDVDTAGSLIELNSSLLASMAPVLRDVRPDISLVHGDTATALNAALASFYSNTFIGHVEAGLRTHNIRAPFPEEFNRKAITAI